VLAELAEMLRVRDDRERVGRDVLAVLGEPLHLDQQALSRVAGTKAVRLDGLDRAKRGLGVL
jgi:hypothetical protein